MTKKMILVVYVFMALFVSLQANAAPPVVSDYSAAGSTNPICASPGTLTYDAPINLKAEGAPGINFDYATVKLDSDGNAAPVFIRKGIPGATPVNWKVITYGKLFANPSTAECQGTASFDYVGQLLSVLYLKSGSNYKVCVPHPMDPTTRWTFDIQIPVSDFSTITTLIPYYTSSTTMFVLVGDGTNSAVYALGIPAGGSTIAASLVGVKLNGVVLTSVHGSPDLIYSHVSKGFIKTATNTADTTTIDPTYTVVNSYLLRLNTLITATTSAGTAGDIYDISGSTITQLSYTGTTNTRYLDFGDNLNNFVRIGSNYMYWRHATLTSGTYLTSDIPIAEINSGASGAIENVALSGDKAVILWSNKIIYFKHVSNGSVKKVYETSTPGLTLTGEYEYILKLSCACKQIKRFACFSSTLNCIIVKKGQDSCGTEDTFGTQAD